MARILRGEIRWANLNPTVGNEQAGLRPVLILSRYAYPVDTGKVSCQGNAMARPSFPKTLREFRERFVEEADCYDYLMQSRWPEGIVCPRCQGRQFWRRS